MLAESYRLQLHTSPLLRARCPHSDPAAAGKPVGLGSPARKARKLASSVAFLFDAETCSSLLLLLHALREIVVLAIEHSLVHRARTISPPKQQPLAAERLSRRSRLLFEAVQAFRGLPQTFPPQQRNRNSTFQRSASDYVLLVTCGLDEVRDHDGVQGIPFPPITVSRCRALAFLIPELPGNVTPC